jgi:methoxymalonate biosynthesis acyl carrier protein
MDDIKQRLTGFLAPHMGGQRPRDDEDIFALGYLNSLFVLQLVHFIEREYELSIGPEDLEFDNFRTVAGITALVSAKKGIAA